MATIRKRGNTYQFVVSDGYNSDDKQIKRYKTWTPPSDMSESKIKKEVDKQAILFEEYVKKGNYSNGNIKFQDFAEQWFIDYGEKRLRPRTYYRYKEMSKRVYEELGHRKLKDIRISHINDFLRKLAEPGQNKRTGQSLSPKTIKNYLSFISSVMQTAVRCQMIENNPCSVVEPPHIHKTEINCLSEEEVEKFIAYLEQEPIEYRTMMMLLLLLGLRRGELLGLEWPDIDFNSKVISINRTSQYIPPKGNYTDTTKTVSSQRSIRVSDAMLELLKQYKAWQEERLKKAGDAWVKEWTEHPRLFTQWNGKPMFNNTPYRFLERFTKKHGFNHISLHSLRHTNATLLISEGADIKAVSALLGHSQTSTTLNIYTHAVQKAQAAATESLSEKLFENLKASESDQRAPDNGQNKK